VTWLFHQAPDVIPFSIGIITIPPIIPVRQAPNFLINRLKICATGVIRRQQIQGGYLSPTTDQGWRLGLLQVD
jgi:hypothetical protein